MPLVYEQLHRELVKRDVLHCDETTLQLLNEPRKALESKSNMVAVSNETVSD